MNFVYLINLLILKHITRKMYVITILVRTVVKVTFWFI